MIFEYLLIRRPLLIELLWEITFLAKNLGSEFFRVEGEFYAELRVEVDEGVGGALFSLNRILSSNFRNHGDASIWKFYVLLVQLKVLL